LRRSPVSPYVQKKLQCNRVEPKNKHCVETAVVLASEKVYQKEIEANDPANGAYDDVENHI